MIIPIPSNPPKTMPINFIHKKPPALIKPPKKTYSDPESIESFSSENTSTQDIFDVFDENSPTFSNINNFSWENFSLDEIVSENEENNNKNSNTNSSCS